MVVESDLAPDQAEMKSVIKFVTDKAPRCITLNYERDRHQLVTLYEKAMGSQWNSVTDLDWSVDVDPEELVRTSPPEYLTLVELARAAAEVPGSPFAKWSEKEFVQLGIESFVGSLSGFMHGEQGAMMIAAKLVETVPWIDAKYYAATQTMDEARHTEVFAKYLHTKLGDPYPPSPFVEQQIEALVGDHRWDIAYLGMQIVAESLALAAFGSMVRAIREPLLTKLLRYVMSDEARHVAFGVLSLSEHYQHLTDAELEEREEFLLEFTLHSRAGAIRPEIWERMGTSADAVGPSLTAAAQSTTIDPLATFQAGFFGKLVPNVRKLGLLDGRRGRLREKWAEAGLLQYEFADDTGTDYESYDEVTKDRAATR